MILKENFAVKLASLYCRPGPPDQAMVSLTLLLVLRYRTNSSTAFNRTSWSGLAKSQKKSRKTRFCCRTPAERSGSANFTGSSTISTDITTQQHNCCSCCDRSNNVFRRADIVSGSPLPPRCFFFFLRSISLTAFSQELLCGATQWR